MAARMLFCRKTNQHGFTLLEVLVSLAILAVGLLAAASMQGLAMNSNHVANRISVADMLGQLVLEDLHSRKITDPILTTATPAAGALYQLTPAAPLAVPPVAASNLRTIAGAGVFRAQYFITPNTVNGVAQTGTTEIRVVISYLNTAVSSYSPGTPGAAADPNAWIPTRTFRTYKTLKE